MLRAGTAKLPRSFWGWDEIIEMNKGGYWPYTPNTNLLYGLNEALEMIADEGLDNVFARHNRLAEACRRAVRAWGLEIQCEDPSVYSPVLTGVMTPPGIDADAVRKVIYERFDMSLGTGLGKMKGRMFRIGHLGDCNDLTLMATLAGCEMGLQAGGRSARGKRLAGGDGLSDFRGESGRLQGRSLIGPAAPADPVPYPSLNELRTERGRSNAGFMDSRHDARRRAASTPRSRHRKSRRQTMKRFRITSATSIVLIMLCIMYFITYLDRVNVSTAAAGFGKEFGLSNTQIGLVFSAFAYPYLVFQVIGGWVSDRFGAKRTLLFCGGLWALATLLTGFAGGLASLLWPRVSCSASARARPSRPPPRRCRAGSRRSGEASRRALRTRRRASATRSRRVRSCW